MSAGRPAIAPGAVLGRSGGLEVSLARGAADVSRAQRLRYAVFFEEMAATPGAVARFTRHDADRFDLICDHLIVTDRSGARPRVVGAYRLLRQEIADAHGGFYAQSEFDVAALTTRHPDLRFLELGRSCVLKPWRDKRTVELLWQGVWAYVRAHRIDALFGCASFQGADPSRHADALAFLRRHARPDAAWRVAAQPSSAAVPTAAREINEARAVRALPPLIRGYARLGAWFSEEAVADRAFNTTDVLTILPVARINPRYVDYFGEEAGRFAA